MLKVDPPKGYPTNDFHHVSTSNLPVGTESWNPTVTNVVVDKPFASFHFNYLGPHPGYVYEISLGDPANKKWVTHDGPWVNINGSYSEWILRKVKDDVYNVTPNDGSGLYWTDMGPESGPDRQLQLVPYGKGPKPHSQEFRIV